MTRGIGRLVPVLIAFSLGTGAAQVASLSGTWQLNVEKSSWGKARKPVSVMLHITHQEPALKYTGVAVDAEGEAARPFGFEGAIDGEEYPMTRSYGDGKVVLKREGSSTVSSVFKSDDGRYTETARTRVSADRKTLLRRIRVAGPETNVAWSEVYDRK